MAKKSSKKAVSVKPATKKAVTKVEAKSTKSAKTTEPAKSDKPSKKSSQIEEVGKNIYSFATQGQMRKGWEIEEFAKSQGVEVKVIVHETASHQAKIEISLGKEKLTIPSEGYLTITQ